MSTQDATPDPIRIIAGSGRSGTTWVLDALAEANALRPVFEPLHPLAIPQAQPFAYRYYRTSADHPNARDYLAGVFAGTFTSWWTDYRVRPDRLRPSLDAFRSVTACHEYMRRWRKLYERQQRLRTALGRRHRLVKFIRANLMLGWIHAQFDARSILVLRHPGAVIESRLRLGGDDWEPQEQLKYYLDQRQLQDDYLFRYNDLLSGPLSAAEAQTVIWCIENQLPLSQPPSTHCRVAHYEHLLSGEPDAWRSVLDTLSLSHMPAAALLAHPSQSAAMTPGTRSGASYAAQWQERLDETSRREIAAILAAMDVTVYSVDDPMPRVGVPAPAQPQPQTTA